MQSHVTDFTNTLYNQEPEIRRAIIVLDRTYIRVPRNSNFRVMRQSFSPHKHYFLLKPIMLVAPNGHILDVHGPYFSDSRNNDANILRDQLRDDIGGLRAWLEEGDIFLVDRGYRDAIQLLQQIGIRVKMPGFAIHNRGRARGSQGDTEEVNESRLVTKSRWIVESRNGHIKSMFKFFSDMVHAPHVRNIGDFFRIGCALINAFRPEILMAGADEGLARLMLERSRMPNALMARVLGENLHLRRAHWVAMQGVDLPEFPRLPFEYLRDFTFGTYQIKLAPGYVQDRIERDRDFGFEVMRFEPGLLRARLYSRHTQRSKYQLWISFREEFRVEEALPLPLEEPITGWYCQCKQGARTLGCCAHIASVLWYLGYARHEANVRYPSNVLLREIQDAGNRDLPDLIDPHRDPEEVGMEPPGERPEDRL